MLLIVKTNIYLTIFLVLFSSAGCFQKTGGETKTNENPERAAVQNISSKESVTEIGLTEKDIRNLIQFWENAQDAGDFEGYRSCYAKPFKGIKTVSNSSREYDYAGWMKDRREMLEKAVGLDVEVKNLLISIDGTTATVEFDQYYRSKSYSDWGPKILKIKQTPDGAKIVYELLKASHRL